MLTTLSAVRSSLSEPARRALVHALVVFLVVRVLLSLWAALVVQIVPEPLWAGLLALLAALTRLMGWTLCLPLAFIYARQRSFDWRNTDWRVLSTLLPLLGLCAFLLWRAASGLPPIAQVYEQFWFQRKAIPAVDSWVALRSLLTGSGPRALFERTVLPLGMGVLSSQRVRLLTISSTLATRS